MLIPNLLLIAGTGTKSGKTTMGCRILKEFNHLSITAIKITPHFHETTKGLISSSKGKGFVIYKETDRNSNKDTSRMLKAGASTVYFAKVWDNELFGVIQKIMEYIPSTTPIICESPALRCFVQPGVFVIMNSKIVGKHKDISRLRTLPHVTLQLEELESIDSLPFGFDNDRWFYK